MRASWFRGGLICVALGGCVGEQPVEIDPGNVEATVEPTVLGYIHGEVRQDGTHVMSFEPGEALVNLAAREGVSVESLVELTQGSGLGRGANPPDTVELITCRSTTVPLCEMQYGPLVYLGRGTEPERCGTIPAGRSDTCDLYPVEIRNFMSSEISNVYLEFIQLRRADGTPFDVQPYDGAPAGTDLAMPMAIGQVYRYGTLEVAPRAAINLEAPFHQASLRRWRLSFPAGTTDFSYVYTARVSATIGAAGQASPHQVSVTSGGAPTSTHDAVHGCTTTNQDYTVFASAQPLLPGVAHAPGYYQVYRVRRRTGEVELVSRSSSGEVGNHSSLHPCITPDGQHVVFESFASNLVSGDTNGAWDVFVRALGSSTTERVSRGASEATSCGRQGGSTHAAISDDGRYVAFSSTCASLCGGNSQTTGCFQGRRQVYRFDRTTSTLEGVSVRDGSSGTIGTGTLWGGAGTTGTAGTHNSHMGGMSRDGSRVTFASTASGAGFLAPSASDTAIRDVFVRQMGTMTTTRISDNRGGTVGSRNAAISADGNFVAFETASASLVAGDANGVVDVVRCAATGGSCALVSAVGGMPTADGASGHPALSADGALVAFDSAATNLVTGDANGQPDVFVRDMSGATVTLVSRNGQGAPGDFPSAHPRFSPDGAYLVYQSRAGNLQANGTGPFDLDSSAWDVFAVRIR